MTDIINNMDQALNASDDELKVTKEKKDIMEEVHEEAENSIEEVHIEPEISILNNNDILTPVEPRIFQMGTPEEESQSQLSEMEAFANKMQNEPMSFDLSLQKLEDPQAILQPRDSQSIIQGEDELQIMEKEEISAPLAQMEDKRYFLNIQTKSHNRLQHNDMDLWLPGLNSHTSFHKVSWRDRMLTSSSLLTNHKILFEQDPQPLSDDGEVSAGCESFNMLESCKNKVDSIFNKEKLPAMWWVKLTEEKSVVVMLKDPRVKLLLLNETGQAVEEAALVSLYGSSTGKGRDIIKKMETEEKRRGEEESDRLESAEHIERQLEVTVCRVKEEIRRQILENIDKFNWKIEEKAKKAANKQGSIQKRFEKRTKELEEKLKSDNEKLILWQKQWRQMLEVKKESETEPFDSEFERNKAKLEEKNKVDILTNLRMFHTEKKRTEDVFKKVKDAHEKAVKQLAMELAKLDVSGNIPEFFSTIHSELECPVCMDDMQQSRIFQCDAGHTLCEGCKDRLARATWTQRAKCPTCKGDVSARNLALERIAGPLYQIN